MVKGTPFFFIIIEPPNSLPATFAHGCHRNFNVSWLGKYPWLRYNQSLDGISCGPCSILLPTDARKDKWQLVNQQFSEN